MKWRVVFRTATLYTLFPASSFGFYLAFEMTLRRGGRGMQWEQWMLGALVKLVNQFIGDVLRESLLQVAGWEFSPRHLTQNAIS